MSPSSRPGHACSRTGYAHPRSPCAPVLAQARVVSFAISSRPTGSGKNCSLFGALDDAQVPIHGLAQHAERFLVGGTVVRGDRLCDAVELEQNGTLAETALVHLRGHPAREEAPAGFL